MNKNHHASLFENIIIILIILQISHASILFSRYIPFAIGAILLFIDIYRKNLSYSNVFKTILMGWVAINVLAILFFGTGWYIERMVIITTNILFLPYLLLRRMGTGFWVNFENIVFKLTIIALPIYFLSLLLPSFFDNLEGVFLRFTNPALTGGSNHYWSAFFYTHISTYDDLYQIKRNCGFMWEPGSYSMILIWAIMFNWLFYDKKPFEIRVLIYSVALLTTFSTAGYIAFAILVSGRFVKKLSFQNIILLAGLLVVFYISIYRLEFVSGKVDQYVEVYQNDPTGEKGYTGSKVNRLQGGITAINRTISFPTGYGLVSEYDRDDKNFSYGTNGLGALLEMWGVFLFPFLMILLYRSILYFSNKPISQTRLSLYLAALLVVFFSNPIARNLFFYFLIISPLLLRKNTLMQRIQK